ncbi:hypothetical protein Bbelb_067700 [Branchiostoma belcheri]|nr:hypothetical protein Bbelb_067700 [Branchiostoma belcheri]
MKLPVNSSDSPASYVDVKNDRRCARSDRHKIGDTGQDSNPGPLRPGTSWAEHATATPHNPMHHTYFTVVPDAVITVVVCERGRADVRLGRRRRTRKADICSGANAADGFTTSPFPEAVSGHIDSCRMRNSYAGVFNRTPNKTRDKAAQSR